MLAGSGGKRRTGSRRGGPAEAPALPAGRSQPSPAGKHPPFHLPRALARTLSPSARLPAAGRRAWE